MENFVKVTISIEVGTGQKREQVIKVPIVDLYGQQGLDFKEKYIPEVYRYFLSDECMNNYVDNLIKPEMFWAIGGEGTDGLLESGFDICDEW